jgi:MarR family transcriptional regulator for hemolysin
MNPPAPDSDELARFERASRPSVAASLRASLLFRVEKAANALRAGLSAHPTAFGLRPLHVRFLLTLEEGPLGQTELGLLFRVNRTSMVAYLRELEELGLVTRSPDPAKFYGLLVSLTPEGRDKCLGLRRALAEIEAAFLRQLPTDQQQAFAAALERFGNDPRDTLQRWFAERP